MKLTPLDIHHKEFRRSLRGYDEKEVDDFLDDVADDFERLFKENIDLSEKLTAANDQLRRYQVNEQTIQNTMLAAQSSAEHIVNKANADADQVLRDAELKAKEIIHHALQQKQRVAGELVRIKAAEEAFRAEFRGVLESANNQVNEVTIPDDVTSLLAEPGEREQAAPPQAAASVPEETDDVPVEPAAGQTAWTPNEDEPEVAPAQWNLEDSPREQPALAEEAPASGVVQAVQLGEVESPDLGAEQVELVEPAEFRMPTLDALGDREDDGDIEEID